MEDPVHDLIPKTSKAITEFDLLQRKEWAKARADALAKWEKARGALEADERNALRELDDVRTKAGEMEDAPEVLTIDNTGNTPEFLTRETICCGEPVTLHSTD